MIVMRDGINSIDHYTATRVSKINRTVKYTHIKICPANIKEL